MFGCGGSVFFTAAQEVTGRFTNTRYRHRISVRQSKLHVTDIPSRTKVEEEVGRASSECQRSTPAVHGGLERGDTRQRLRTTSVPLLEKWRPFSILLAKFRGVPLLSSDIFFLAHAFRVVWCVTNLHRPSLLNGSTSLCSSGTLPELSQPMAGD